MTDFRPQVIAQRDPRWAGDHLGTEQAADDSRIGKYGCVITSIAFLANAAYEINLYTPPTVQFDLLRVGGFVGDTHNLVAWSAVSQIFPRLKLTAIKDTPGPLTEADLEALKLRTVQGVPVIIGVDYTGKSKTPTHYCALTNIYYTTAALQPHGQIADPYYGDLAEIAPRYGDTLSHAILRYVLFDIEIESPTPIDYDQSGQIERARLAGNAS